MFCLALRRKDSAILTGMIYHFKKAALIPRTDYDTSQCNDRMNTTSRGRPCYFCLLTQTEERQCSQLQVYFTNRLLAHKKKSGRGRSSHPPTAGHHTKTTAKGTTSPRNPLRKKNRSADLSEPCDTKESQHSLDFQF